jgi:hypothetical protein
MENNTTNWPELAIGLYDKLTGRNAAITYLFEDMVVEVPSGTGSADRAQWKLSGKLTITTEDKAK